MKNSFKILFGFLILSTFLLFPNGAFLAKASSLQDQLNAAQQKAAAAKAAAALKQQQLTQINNQIGYLSGQISQTQQAINSTNNQINSTQQKISDLTDQISQTQDSLVAEKTKLDNVVASWYMEGSSGFFETIIGADSISQAVEKEQYYDSIRQQLDTEKKKIEGIEADLALQKTNQQNQLATLTGLKNDQTSQQQYLQNNKQQQTALSGSTSSAISELNSEAQQANAEAARIRAILATIYSGSGTPIGSDLISDSSASWYYNQQNYNVAMKPSNLTIHEAGCLVTSLAMVASYYGNGVSPVDVVNASSFDYDGDWLGFHSGIGITISSSGLVNWDTVNSELKAGRPVILSVYTGHGQVYNSDGSNHFIVAWGISNGRYKIADPWWTGGSYNISSVKSMKVIRSY